ncbi:MAG TPA: sensor domain-containing diguanylate cyclase [Thermoanaerobaculia bacterium]|nr:sensor domain-containing diguanylate cyclase [Thermoanaerobaculia bacterium]
MALDTKEEQAADVTRLRDEVQRLALFHEVGKELARTLDLHKILETIMEKVSELLNPDSWSLLLADETTGELHFEIAIGEGAEKLRNAKIAPGQGLAGGCARSGEPVLVADVTKDSRFDASFDQVTGLRTRSIVCVPIRGKERILGVLELVNCLDRGSFREEDVPVLMGLADYAAIALENARYVARIHELTITDDCTTLYNARHLAVVMDSEIYRSGRYGYQFSVVFLDLDHFKKVNDTHGHLVGSKLLFKIGELLKGHIRMIDTAFRYGGDEFVLLLPQTSKVEARKAAVRIRQLLTSRNFFVEEGLDIHVSASFGLATFPEDGRTRKELLKSADEAMYRVKHTSRDAIAVAGDEESPTSPRC